MTSLLLLITLSAQSPPNVVFLTVDTLRADRLGCYGYELDTSPHIDELAERSLVYDNAVTEIPLTGPAFGAMLSSLYPRMTGMHRNGLPMPKDAVLAPELYQKAGYETFCVQSNWTLKRDLSQLHRGFDRYDDDFHGGRWLFFFKPERYADEVTEIALKELEDRDPGKPFFAWIHYSDPHAPYRFHDEFDPHKGSRESSPEGLEQEERVQIEYDSEVAFTDHHIGRVLDALPGENTYIVFLSDHGESLFEHNYLGHGRRIYQPGMHIPLMIAGPGIEPGRTGVPARGLDVAPTLLGLADIDPAPAMLGVDLLADPPESNRIRVVETYGGAVPQLPGAREIMADAPPQWQGVYREAWKLIRNEDETELYNLEQDPAELKNRAGEETQLADDLAALIDEWESKTPSGTAEEADLSEEDLEALESLGYVQ